MSDSLSKQVMLSSLPKGSFWRAKIGGFLDKIWTGLGDAFEIVRIFLSKLAFIREPKLTDSLDDLEKEFGISTNLNLTEDVRRQQLNAKKYDPEGNGSVTDLQNALDNAGFDLVVSENSPAVDPAQFLSQVFTLVLGGFNAFLGRADAFFGKSGGELIVNGPIISSPLVDPFQLGGIFTMGNVGAIMGGYLGVETIERIYQVPTNPKDWPLVFFVSGPVVRDGITGELIEVSLGDVPSERRTELVTLIVGTKGLHSWCGLVANFT